MLEQALRGEIVLGQCAVAVIVDLARRRGIEQLALHAEGIRQFHVGPVVQWVAQGVRHGPGPHFELLPVGRVARAIAFSHAVGTHGAPLVMVAV